jgi:hypothetical protein
MTNEAHRSSRGIVETPLRRWPAVALSALVVLSLSALVGWKLIDGGHERCPVPAIGFYAAPGTDPDIPAQQWVEEYWREPVDGVASREGTDEQARPTRVVTWKSETKSIESTMSEFPDGSWQGGLHSC